jgi:hypothetical protein
MCYVGVRCCTVHNRLDVRKKFRIPTILLYGSDFGISLVYLLIKLKRQGMV